VASGWLARPGLKAKPPLFAALRRIDPAKFDRSSLSMIKVYWLLGVCPNAPAVTGLKGMAIQGNAFG
jgi:hypothetical protein